MDSEFRNSWLETTKGIFQHYGSLGSRLHKEVGTSCVYLGYAQWPSRESWKSKKRDLPEPYLSHQKKMRECLLSVEVLHEMDVVDDWLQSDANGTLND